MMRKKGTVYWLTGLSGAGKTTVGFELVKILENQGKDVVRLDGDLLREVFGSTDYTLEGRKKISFQYSRMCKMLADQGFDVVACVIAMFDEVRKWNRDNIENYIEVYLKVPIEKLIERDQKGLYTKVLNKEAANVMGMDVPFEEPKEPSLIIDNGGALSPREAAERITVNESSYFGSGTGNKTKKIYEESPKGNA